LSEYPFIRGDRGPDKPVGHVPIGGAAMVRAPSRSRHLLQPLEEMNAAQVVEVTARKGAPLAGDAIDESK
jgi:hypothetical protein